VKRTARKGAAKPKAKAKRPAASRAKPAKARTAASSAQKIAYGSEPGFPISMALRAGDFVFTSAQGDHGFNPADLVYDEKGLVLSDGADVPPRTMAEETRAVLRNLEATLREAGCTLEDVVDSSVWLRDPRDFHAMNEAYKEFFKRDCPTRSIFRVDFMFDCRIEIKVTAYKPLGAKPASRKAGSRRRKG
jgi:enamine deaminase RidA (YjgF/YER057c/UK114 family)